MWVTRKEVAKQAGACGEREGLREREKNENERTAKSGLTPRDVFKLVDA
jgi:hypothetical protein